MGRVTVMVVFFVLIAAIGQSREQEPGSERSERMKAIREKAMREDEAKRLKVGDIAPTFKLKSLDGKQETDLKELIGKKPIILFFGSYT